MKGLPGESSSTIRIRLTWDVPTASLESLMADLAEAARRNGAVMPDAD